ncbi:MAG: GNAT family N-acetyltransferase [Lachnospiraceae bacterium]|nr:GNAT family N-acetyltransferase [Lachnospiraceae bacterium]
MHRLYEYGDIAVFWDSDKCRHAKRCVTGSPETFEFGRRPWIDLSKAPTATIWKTIAKCPSGALTCSYTHDIAIKLDPENNRSVAYPASGSAPGEPVRQIGECDYRITEDGWVIYHTEVSPEYGGRGIAKRLVYKVIEAAERAGAKVIPTCSYAAKILAE